MAGLPRHLNNNTELPTADKCGRKKKQNKNKMKKIYLIASLAFTTSAFAQYTNLYNFGSTISGGEPYGDLISDGTFLYGMTLNSGTHNDGTVFKIKPDGTSFDTLLSFNGANGSGPHGSLYYDGIFLYGMTPSGGTNSLGNIFKIKPDGTGYVDLYNFAASPDGNYPAGSLISDGTFLYGMTKQGGASLGYGTIFKIMPNGSGYIKLVDFGVGSADGSGPYGSLIYDAASGFLYGMTLQGGTHSLGNVFKVKPDGTGYVDILNFGTGNANGASPYGSLYYDGTFLYGMTSSGGTSSYGNIFKVMPDGTGYVDLFDYTNANRGSPEGSLVSDGTFLYGMTHGGGTSYIGVVFKIKLDGTGYDTLFNFNGMGANGAYPHGSLLLNGGCLYGMTYQGGSSTGVIFSYCLASTGIKQVTGSNEVSIYPNPASTSLTLTLSKGEGTSTLLITDMLGNTVKQLIIHNSSLIIDVADLSEGVYNVSISSNAGVVNKRVVIVR
ncbi:MAG: T9SS type A sorting domain-containing protein [Legionellales bacterium]